MLTYQVRPRVFILEEGKSFSFPSHGEIRFHFGPLQPFGVQADGGRTAVRGVAASALFDANTGAHTIKSKQPLRPIDVTIEETQRMVIWKGNVLSVSQHFESIKILSEMVESIYFAVPMLLNVEFADPPFVKRVDGFIGTTCFRWQLQKWCASFRTTTQEYQETFAALSWQRLNLLSYPARRRLLAALHYFHVACRLSHEGVTPGEFLAEVLLNLSKTLEVLFPPGGDGRTRDAVRRKLAKLGFSEVEIEGDYLPAMALRNEIDVGHVDLGLFKQDQLALIHAYVDRAEEAFRMLLNRLLIKIASGEFEIEAYEPSPLRTEAIGVVERLRQHADRYAL